MIEGVIYKYTSPSGKVYIGQTTNESLRRGNWFSSDYHYAGAKIDRARSKYGKENFTYSVIIRGQFSSKEIAVKIFNKLECYYIEKYNSYKAGYNCTIGGDDVLGYKFSEEVLKRLSLKNKGKKLSEKTKQLIGVKSKQWQNTPEGKLKMSIARKGNSHIIHKENPNFKKAPISQYSLKGEFIRDFKSVREASNTLNICATNISAVCKGRRYSSGGFVWRYKEENNPKCIEVSTQLLYGKEKSVSKYSLSGNYICSYPSLKEAGKENNVSRENISSCIRGKAKSAGGFLWKEGCESITINKYNSLLQKPVVQLDKNNNVIATYKSITEAGKKVGINSSNIGACCRRERTSAGDYFWKFLT